MIPVTKSFLPPLGDYHAQVKKIWANQWLTNRGPLVLELEETLKDYLHTPNIIITNNGTVPLQIALKMFGKQGEVITTPFSYVATTAAIVSAWHFVVYREPFFRHSVRSRSNPPKKFSCTRKVS